MYEFSLAFSWGILSMTLFFQRRYQALIITLIGVCIALGLLGFAYTLPSKPVPLVPALQHSWLLTAHVAVAVIAYGAFAVGFAAAIIYLFRRKSSGSFPKAEALDDVSYLSVKIGFPFMTLVIVLGALWADVAWGRYWGWDPKETWSLVTWLLYAALLHQRLAIGWKGRKAAIMAMAGFLAVVFTFLGVNYLPGLHAYLN